MDYVPQLAMPACETSFPNSFSEALQQISAFEALQSIETAEGKSPTPEPPPMTPQARSRAHFHQKYHSIKYLGSGDNGEVYAGISRECAVDLIIAHGGEKTQAFYDSIRRNLIAAKFAKDNNLEGDLEDEIEFLTEDFKHQHPNLTPALDSYCEDESQYIVLPFCSGGNLMSFTKNFPTALSLSFRWHVALQLAEGLLFFLFGIRDSPVPGIRPAKNWPQCYHGDIFPGNILLSPPTATSYSGFPDAVIADFGRAKRFWNDQPQAERFKRLQFQIQQVQDIQAIGHVMLDLQQKGVQGKVKKCTCGKHDCEVYTLDPRDPTLASEMLFQEFGYRLQNFGVSVLRNDLLEGALLLQRLIAIAKTEREEHRERFHPDAVAGMAKMQISNEELDAALREAI